MEEENNRMEMELNQMDQEEVLRNNLLSIYIVYIAVILYSWLNIVFKIGIMIVNTLIQLHINFETEEVITSKPFNLI